MKKETIEISKIIFYISFSLEVLGFLLLFLNNFLSLGNIVANLFIFMLINAPVLIGLSIYRIVKKDYVLPIIALVVSVIVIVLFGLLLNALANFT